MDMAYMWTFSILIPLACCCVFCFLGLRKHHLYNPDEFQNSTTQHSGPKPAWQQEKALTDQSRFNKAILETTGDVAARKFEMLHDASNLERGQMVSAMVPSFSGVPPAGRAQTPSLPGGVDILELAPVRATMSRAIDDSTQASRMWKNRSTDFLALPWHDPSSSNREGASSPKERCSFSDDPEVSAISCPIGHPVITIPVLDVRCTCAMCGTALSAGAALWGCGECRNYQLCSACGRVQCPASAPPVLAWQDPPEQPHTPLPPFFDERWLKPSEKLERLAEDSSAWQELQAAPAVVLHPSVLT